MFLRSLVIRGFKSFADRATLDFEPGVTVVVGPNGSGKSNVVDAIAWVLGAQAPTAVRSQRMDDVIFAGTSARPALGRAEVSLTIDNSSGYLPIDFSEVTVRRTLFRSGDSEYAINGVSCRLLDVQELLSDVGVGRQQHVIASQGQLDTILNARPEERRAMIEEAAGVLKHRKRRERSERRLAAAEADLTRVSDLQREVRRQLRPLERQARAARRADELGRQARALRRLVAEREIGALRARVDAQRAEQSSLEARSGELARGRTEVEQRIGEAEAALAAVGAGELGERVARAATVRERARGVAAVLAERRRAREREAARAGDGSAVAVLEAELADVDREAAEQAAEADRLEVARASLAEEQAALDAERASLDGDGAGGRRRDPSGGGRQPAHGGPSGLSGGHRPDPSAGGPPPARQLDELRRELAGVRAGVEQRQAELGRLATRRQQLLSRIERLRAEVVGADRADEGVEDAEEALARAAERSERDRQAAEDRLARAEAARREADAAHRGWVARAEALGQALDEVRARAGAARLAGQSGVLGVLLDVVEVDAGWEAAVEAAAGDALTAVVVEDTRAARAALDALERAGATGAVVPAAGPGARPEGSEGSEGPGGSEGSEGSGGAVGSEGSERSGGAVGAEGGDGATGEPEGSRGAARADGARAALRPPAAGAHRPDAGGPGRWGEPVAGHVRARRDLPAPLRAAVDRLVQLVVGDAVRVEGGWADAADAAGAASTHPGIVLVTGGGDRFAATGWRLGAARARATGDLHREALRRAEAAEADQRAAAEEHRAARAELERARQAHSRAVRACDEHAARAREAAAAARRTHRDLGEAVAELAQLDGQVAQLEAAVEEARRRQRSAAERLPALEAAADEAAAAARSRAEATAAFDRRQSDLTRRRLQVDVRAAAVAERRAALDQRRAGLERSRRAAQLAEEERRDRRRRLEERAGVEARLEAVVAACVARVEAELAARRAEHTRRQEEVRALESQLSGLRRERAALEAHWAQTAERARQVELALTESAVRLEAAQMAAQRELGDAAGGPPRPLATARPLAGGAETEAGRPGAQPPGAAAPAGAEAETGGAADEAERGTAGRADRLEAGAAGGAELPEGATAARAGVAMAEELPDLPEGVDPLDRLAELDAELRQLGPVNPLAGQEHAALLERLELLDAQVADVRESRRELARVVRAIDDEIAATFAAAYADVDTHFRQLFATLFPGGHGALRLTDPDDLGSSGVDVDARPSGKNVRKLSLLSGGERALTALGLLFAIFRSRPSPFYVLDEVEAALDDVNLRRFLDLLDEFRADAQLIVVSHQKRTMEAADCLYGVTMKPGGSSVVVSERIRAAS